VVLALCLFNASIFIEVPVKFVNSLSEIWSWEANW
jgi:hypothetical protein